jgi:NADP-dependent 3-hydroxy acid dehydrogenase YdfG
MTIALQRVICPAQEVVREITALGGDAVACTESVATPEGGKAIIAAALDRYGRIDILIHNAGLMTGCHNVQDYRSLCACRQRSPRR